jgi:hypothetical protein
MTHPPGEQIHLHSLAALVACIPAHKGTLGQGAVRILLEGPVRWLALLCNWVHAYADADEQATGWHPLANRAPSALRLLSALKSRYGMQTDVLLHASKLVGRFAHQVVLSQEY